MGIQRNNNTTSTKAERAATIQPPPLNGVNMTKTNLYDNNEEHTNILTFARTKVFNSDGTPKVEADENGILCADVNKHTVRFYGFKKKVDDSSFVALV